MKAKNLNTIESFIKKYGSKTLSEYPTPVGQQQSGSAAKANSKIKQKDGGAGWDAQADAQKSLTKPSQSQMMKPSVSTALTGKAPEENPEPPREPAKDLEPGTTALDKNNNEITIVGGAGGNSNKPETVVAKDKTGKYVQLEPEDELEVPELEENSIKDIMDKKSKKRHRLNKRIKRLVRQVKLREQGSELLFEINFNDPTLIKQSLDLPIKCGFEAETSWDSVYGGGDDEDSEWLYEYSWYDISDFIRDQEGSNAAARVEDSYNEWIVEGPAMDLESDIIDEMVADREEDEYYLNKYIEDELSEDDIEEYKDDKLDNLRNIINQGDMFSDWVYVDAAKAELEEYEDWDLSNWGRQYVEEEKLDEYKDWLREDIRDNGEAWDDAISRAQDEYDMDRWASNEYGSWASCLYEHDIYLSNPDGGEGGGQEEVAEYLTSWTDENSQYQDVKAGDYHSNAGDTDQDYWRVEADSSIQTSGTGSEIISPVYRTPRKMLEEMKSLFAWLENQDVDTNSSTGLHVTMSLDNDEWVRLNPVKLAVLLGDKYLLSTFGRENNSYAKSQYKNLEKLGNRLKSNPDAKTIQQIEDILSSGISRDKFSSINFKDQRDRNTDNQLIEFRIGGGNDYHRDFNTAAKAVMRYAVTMQAAYSDKLYNRDYAKALYRLINNVGKISADDEERVKDRINPDVEAPAVDVLKDYFSKDNYVEHLRYLAAAYNLLAEYKQLKNKQNEDVETDGPDADRLQDLLNKAQKYFASAIAQAGYDLSQGHNRATPNAKSIGTLRSALKDFELDYEKLSNLIDANSIDTGDRRSNLTPKQILGRIKNGVDKLFKKDVVQEPEYLSANQVEKMITGMWNAVHSGKLQDGQQAIKFAKLLADAANTTTDYAAAWLDQANSGSRGREYKEFHKSVTQGSYGEQAMFTPGNPADSKKLKAFIDHLKQYPEWNHPVSSKHDPRRTHDDSYIDNALSKMLIKMRARWEHLEDIREENPGEYIDSMREIANLVRALVKDVSTSDEYMHNIYDDLAGTDHVNHRDGEMYFGMLERNAEELLDTVEKIDRPTPFEDPVAHQLRDRIQNYLRRCYDRYYTVKDRENDGFYKIGSVPDLIKKRTDAIKEFLTGFDKVAQSHGFDSQSSEIANKKQLDKKQAKFKKKYGPRTFKVDAFDFGGYIFAEKGFAQGIEHMAPEGVARALQQTSNIHRTDYGELLIMPTIHYFTALEASKMLSNPEQYKDTWRWEKARAVLRKFESTYKIDFQDLDDKYVDINDDNQRVRTKLTQQNVEFTKNLGDGREGVGKFGPLIPRADLTGPDGEPFEPSAAVTWRINRDQEKAAAPDSQVLQDFGKARVNFTMFDYMMNNGIGNYVKGNEKQDLVAFLNNETQVDAATKEKMLTIMINNVDDDQRAPMGISQALVKAKSQSENMNTFDKFDKLPLAEQLRILAKVDKKKIDEAWSKKYKDSINCSNPKGFSQKAHCAGKKKKVSERPLTKGEEKDKEKYVKGMKKNAKDFKKRYGKDAKAVMYATATKMAKEGVAEGAVPIHNAKRDYEKIVSEPLLGSDLKGQMNAYFVVPDPEMIHAFRERIAQAGNNVDLRPIFRNFAKKQLHPKVKALIAESKLAEAKGLFGRNAGDKFVHTDGREYAIVDITAYPDPQTQRYESPEQRDEVIAKIEAEYNSKIEWVNNPNKGMLAFGIATLDDADGGHVHWGKYLQFSKHDMLGTWSNNQVPAGWKLATKGAQKLQAGYDPQHLIKTENIFNSAEEIIKTVESNSPDDVKEMFVDTLNNLNQGQGSVIFQGMWSQQEAIRDYFGEIMQPVALMGGVIRGDAEEARRVLADGAEWRECRVMFPMAMNAALCDSFMIAPNGQEIGISTKGGSGAKASAKNLYDAAKKAEGEGNTELLDAHKFTVDIVTMVHEQSAKDGPVVIGEYLGIDGVDQNLQKEINTYMANGKADLKGISKQALQILSPFKVQLETTGFNAGYAILSAIAKTVAAKINENPEFTKGALALLNQSSIVQIYTKMGKKGEDAILGEFKAVYPPNFEGRILMDGGKNYYSSRVGGKLAFGFK